MSLFQKLKFWNNSNKNREGAEGEKGMEYLILSTRLSAGELQGGESHFVLVFAFLLHLICLFAVKFFVIAQHQYIWS
jgi:hypothetical protein